MLQGFPPADKLIGRVENTNANEKESKMHADKNYAVYNRITTKTETGFYWALYGADIVENKLGEWVLLHSGEEATRAIAATRAKKWLAFYRRRRNAATV